LFERIELYWLISHVKAEPEIQWLVIQKPVFGVPVNLKSVGPLYPCAICLKGGIFYTETSKSTDHGI
jgi:hypothetical protein